MAISISAPGESLETSRWSRAPSQGTRNPTPKLPPAKAKVASRTPANRRRRHVPKTELLFATTQLTIMCESGVDLAGALGEVAAQCRNVELKRIMTMVSDDVNSGMSASVALQKHAETFGETYVASIAAAEMSGTLDTVLPRLCESLKNQIQLETTIRSLLAYPIVLIGVATLVIAVLVFFVLPQFSTVFENLGRPAPPMTQMLLTGALFLRSHIWWVVAIAGGGAIAGYQLARTSAARRYRDQVLVSAPLVRQAICAVISGRMFRLLGMLLSSGVPLLEGLRLCRTSIRNQLFVELLDQLEEDVVNGRGLGMAFRNSKVIPPGAAQMISTAEQAGRLGTVLQMIGKHYTDEGEQGIRQLVRTLEPVVIVTMGVVVGGIVMCIMLPLLDVTTGHS